MSVKKVAIACQGGGTHAAFTWGVLREILRTKTLWKHSSGAGNNFDIIALSGTSAGALCALAAWYGLAPNTAAADCGTVEKAIERLDFLWTTFAATTPVESAHNQVVQALLQWGSKGAPLPSASPYDIYGNVGLTGLALLGARQQYLGFPALLEALCPDFATIDWRGLVKKDLRMICGAIEVLSGNFEIFDSDKSLENLGLMPEPEQPKISQYGSTRWRMRRALSLEGVAASGTLPDVLPAQIIKDVVFPTCVPGETITRDGHYWDGLYSQNPPVRDLLDANNKAAKPDEIWVVRINPQEFRPASSNVGLAEIKDRENALAGNLSLNQELDHILTFNRWIEKYETGHPLLDNRKTVAVRTIKMTAETARALQYTSKFDRSAEHLARLREEGEAVAQQWLQDWREQGDVFATYPNDARYPEPADVT